MNIVKVYTGTVPATCTTCGAPFDTGNAETAEYCRGYGWHDSITGSYVPPAVWCVECEDARRTKLRALSAGSDPAAGAYGHCTVCGNVLALVVHPVGAPAITDVMCCGQQLIAGIP